ncbi:MAG: hypothetical protein A3C64_00435 [Candidatus Yanofskybacteria bacterium RIFCSPHIGHO2_02_FULL_41_12]|nr:MAG: hypothetical protein A3C64_00435 [Candidatus Yanofskybacteria bacterium RIFCSPHIGHO2_02_FULL_41_12]
MEPRLQKQLIVGLVFVLIFLLLGYGVFVWVRVEPTCFDNIKNGKEDGLDCGLLACGKTCEPAILPLEIKSSQYLQTGIGDYDFVAKVYNANTIYGASSFDYSLSFTDANGVELMKSNGSSYILPGQTKFLTAVSLKINGEAANVSMTINSVQWSKIQPFDSVVNFMIRRQTFSPNVNGNSRFDATLYNSSNFDFDKVDVSVVLLDEAENITGVGKTDIRTFLSGTERGFQIQWPYSADSTVANVAIEASTNVFENSNFIKNYGTQEKFQKFY